MPYVKPSHIFFKYRLYILFESMRSMLDLMIHLYLLLLIAYGSEETAVKIINISKIQQIKNFSIESQNEKVKARLFIVSNIWSSDKGKITLTNPCCDYLS